VSGQAPTSSAAVELILTRLRESGEFPAMSRTVGAISELTPSTDTSTSALANAVLQDYGLTQKLLRPLPSRAAVPLRGAQDLFGLAMTQARDLVLKDLTAPSLEPLLPDWYRPTMAGRRYAVILPLVVNQKSVGLFYIDGDDAGARLLSPPVLNSLKVLRTQAVLAIHQSTLRSLARKR